MLIVFVFDAVAVVVNWPLSFLLLVFMFGPSVLSIECRVAAVT